MKSDILPEKCKIVYKRAPTLRDIIAKNVVELPPIKGYTFFTGKGFFSLQILFCLSIL